MRLMLLYPRLPYPPNKGDKIRTYHQLSYLASRHEVWCTCLVDDVRDWAWAPEVQRLCHRFVAYGLDCWTARWRGLAAAARGRSLTEGILDDGRVRALVDRWCDQAYFDAVVCFGSGMGPYGRLVPAGRRVLDLCDLDSLKWADYAQRRTRVLRPLFGAESQRVAELEQRLLDEFDAVTLVTEQERRASPAFAGHPKVHVVGNGVDHGALSACGEPAAEPVVTFVGALDYWPNVEGVCWFASEVWPRVRRSVPRAEWVIVGRRPGHKVLRLGRLDGVQVEGEVPEVVSYLRGSRVVVAPLLTGRGIQNKVLEGMAAGRPVVATRQAAEGITNESIAGLRVAATAEELAAALIEYLSLDVMARSSGAEGQRFVRAHYSWAARMEQFERVVCGAAPTAPEPRSVPARTAEWPGTELAELRA